jgi:uncharacterized 2Fe-2S/4Fe-4S cluster protein (DUF4445 family)
MYDNKLSDIAQQRMGLAANEGQQATNLMSTGAGLIGTAADVAAMGETGTGLVNTGRNNVGLENIAKTEPAKILANNNKLGLTDNDNLRTQLMKPSNLAQQLMERKSWE